MNTQQFYINGQWRDAIHGTQCQVINPSTGESCGTITLGGEADTNAAVAAAKTAFTRWSQTTAEERLTLLEKLAEIYSKRSEEIAQAMSKEMGAPIDMARNSQAGVGASHIKDSIATFRAFQLERELSEQTQDNRILYEPIGVCGLITPWNWPMNQITLKVVPALAAGCTMVLKPSELSPLSALLFAEVVDEAGIPAGVFNLVNGDGAGVGTQLSGHPDVDMISFTGSTRAGTAISRNAAATIKRVSLELGGKGANIIFADADEKAVTRGTRHCFNNTGQSCNAPTRMLVERSYYDEAVAIAGDVAGKTQVDLASKEGRHIGPLVSQQQYDKVQALIEKGLEEGARLVAGGLGHPQGLEQGYFVQPTVFADVSNDMTIAREEIFGPVLSIIPFDSEEQAIAMANDTVYGLSNYLQTSDKEKAQRVARALRSGMVEINGRGLGACSPFGGYRQSGNGREGGIWGLEDFLEVKAVSGWEA